MIPPPYTDPAPSGNDSAGAQEFYRWIFEQYFAQFPVERWEFNWLPFSWLFFWAAVLIAGFFVFGWFFRGVHRPRGELYGPSSFNAYLLERIGQLSWFSWIIWGGVAVSALYFLVTHALFGQSY